MKDAFVLVYLLFSLYVMCSVWKCLKATLRDSLRDTLFDLRDEWRNFYVDNRLDMRDGAYEALRDMLNSQIRNTQELRFIGFVYFLTHIDPDLQQSISRKKDDCFSKCDAKTAEKVKWIRKSSSNAILYYIAMTSLGFISCFVLLIPRQVITRMKIAIVKLVRINEGAVECASGAYQKRIA